MMPPNPNEPSNLVGELERCAGDSSDNIEIPAPPPDTYTQQMYSLGYGLPIKGGLCDETTNERIQVGTVVALLADGSPRRMDDSSAGESALCVATSTGAQHADEVRKCDTSFQQPNISVLWGPGLEGTDIICKDSECACIRQFTLKLQGKIGSFLILESPENSVMVETDKISILTTMVEYLHTLSKKEDECADPETLVFVTGTIKATAFYGAIIQQLPESNTNNPAASSPRLDVMLDGLGDYTCEVSSVKLSKQYYACTDRSVLPKPPMHTLFVQFLVIKVRDQHPMPPREVMGSSTTRSKPRDSDPTYLRLATATSDFVKPLLEYILANAPSATAAAASDADVEALFEGRIPTDLSSAALQQQLERCSPDIVVEAVGCYHVGRLGHNKET